MLRYTLDDFKRIESQGIQYKLNTSVCDIIQSIADQVGAPEYIKTPQFNKRHRGYHIKNSHGDTRTFKLTKKKNKRRHRTLYGCYQKAS